MSYLIKNNSNISCRVRKAITSPTTIIIELINGMNFHDPMKHGCPTDVVLVSAIDLPFIDVNSGK